MVHRRCLIKEDAIYGEVGFGSRVSGPVGVGLDIGRDLAVGAVGVIGTDIADCLDVFVRVELVNSSDIIAGRIRIRGTRAGVGIHDHLPVNVGGGSNCTEDGIPFTAEWIDVKGEKERRCCGRSGPSKYNKSFC